MEHKRASSTENSRQTDGLLRRSKPPATESVLHPVQELQQNAGNQAVQEWLRSGALQPKLEVRSPADPAEQEADRMADQIMEAPGHATAARSPSPASGGEMSQECQQQAAPQRQAAGPGASPGLVGEVISSTGSPLDPATRQFMEERFDHDFSGVRVHTDARAAESAKSLSAQAYTAGNNIVFGPGQYSPGTSTGRKLVAHELGHVIQQGGGGLPNTPASGPAGQATIQRKVEMRDVGRGENSGLARLPELIARLNAASPGLIFSVTGTALNYALKPGGTLNNFDRQMMAFIDQDAILPLRLTNRQGLLGNRAAGFHDRVLEDDWQSGYVDIDDLLSSSDLGLQVALVHFLRERAVTNNYAKRIGSPSLDPTSPEFQRAHQRGIDAEVELLQDYFGDPTIRFGWEPNDPEIFRVYVNGRRDHIRTRVHSLTGAQQGVDRITVEVLTRDGVIHPPEDYRRLLHP